MAGIVHQRDRRRRRRRRREGKRAGQRQATRKRERERERRRNGGAFLLASSPVPPLAGPDKSRPSS